MTIVTLGVQDLKRSIRFYEAGIGLQRVPYEPETIAFFDLAGAQLALFPRIGLAEDAGVSGIGDGFRGVSLARFPWLLANHGAGQMLLVVRHRDAYSARFVSTVGIFHCAGARTDEGNDLLKRAYLTGGHDEVRSLRREEHAVEANCWLHTPRFCLSRLAVDE